MAIDLNKTITIGRLTQDAEIRTTPNGSRVARISIAVNRSFKQNDEIKDEVSYFNCTAWGKLVDIIEKYTAKGKQVAIEGHLKQSRWEDQQSGQKRSSVEIVIERVQLLGSKPETSENSEPEKKTESSQEKSIMDESPQFDDDIPF